jgi:Recombinase
MYSRAGMGIREIARELNRMNVSTPTGAGKWRPETVSRVIRARASQKAAQEAI